MIDLHIHSKYSDGSSSVEEILKEADNKKLQVISITDHNTIAAYKDLDIIKDNYNVDVSSGCEITTTYNGEIIEVLGYDFDINKFEPLLEKNVLTYEQKQAKEFELMCKKYKEIGIIFNKDNVIFDPEKSSCRGAFLSEILKYKDNERFFLNSKNFKNYSKFSRNEVFNPESKLYVDMTSLFPSLEKTISIIHEAGGLAFLAHPFVYSLNIDKILKTVIKDYLFDGIECFYTNFTKKQSKILLEYCKKEKLYVSGGSDFHGNYRRGYSIGVGNSDLNIDISNINSWYKK